MVPQAHLGFPHKDLAPKSKENHMQIHQVLLQNTGLSMGSCYI